MHLSFALPEPSETGDGGGTGYVHGLVDGLRSLGHQVELLTGPNPTFSPGTVRVIDGMLLPHLRDRLDELADTDSIALIHHVSAASTRDAADRQRIHALEQEMLPRLRRIIATSHPVAERLTEDFGVPALTVPPGSREFASSTPDPNDPVVLTVGVLTHRKGHASLLRALARLVDLPWRVVIAGDSRREPAHQSELQALIAELDLAHRATVLLDPSPAALENAWTKATVFALASRWEGYPTAAAEALRRGIPIVVTDAGNPGQLVPPDAGAVCPIDDRATFEKCLRRILFDHDLRADMAAAAWRAGQSLPSWAKRATEFVAIVES